MLKLKPPSFPHKQEYINNIKISTSFNANVLILLTVEAKETECL